MYLCTNYQLTKVKKLMNNSAKEENTVSFYNINKSTEEDFEIDRKHIM